MSGAGCPCGCPDFVHIGDMGCACGLPDEPPCTPDCRPLAEDVSDHTMMSFSGHPDGRSCQYHWRLGCWTFSGRMECLRDDHPDLRRGGGA